MQSLKCLSFIIILAFFVRYIFEVGQWPLHFAKT